MTRAGGGVGEERRRLRWKERRRGEEESRSNSDRRKRNPHQGPATSIQVLELIFKKGRSLMLSSTQHGTETVSSSTGGRCSNTAMSCQLWRDGFDISEARKIVFLFFFLNTWHWKGAQLPIKSLIGNEKGEKFCFFQKNSIWILMMMFLTAAEGSQQWLRKLRNRKILF